MRNVEVPDYVLTHLLTGFINEEADAQVRLFGAERGNFGHAGDPLAKVFAWLWRTDQPEAMSRVAGYLLELRKWNRDAPSPPITLDDVLGALRPPFDGYLDDGEVQAFCERARRDVPEHAGGECY